MTRWRKVVLVLPVLVLTASGQLFAEASPKGDSKERYRPGLAKWRRAAASAIKDRAVWVPVASALVIGAAGWDDDISDWAIETTPIFGSQERAQKVSDDLLLANHLAMIGTAFFPPASSRPWVTRLEFLGWEHAGLLVSKNLTLGIKSATNRERPDGSDQRSFPSGHTSQAFYFATATRRNLRDSSLPPRTRRAVSIGVQTFAVGTAWARVEGGNHFPADVLVGAALGNFISAVFYDVFLERRENVTLVISPARGSLVMEARLRF